MRNFVLPSLLTLPSAWIFSKSSRLRLRASIRSLAWRVIRRGLSANCPSGDYLSQSIIRMTCFTRLSSPRLKLRDMLL
jgi:hypothetical protein